MPRDLLEYHALETGELNRLWYEEHDVRARDAFQLRWWLGGDPIGGKDLLAHYHTAIAHRCFERGIRAEEHQLAVYEKAVAALVADFPADPILKFEDVLMPHVDRALDAVCTELKPAAAPTDAQFRERADRALAGLGEAGTTLREWIDLGGETRGEAEYAAALDGLRRVIAEVEGEASARLHPVVRTALPAKKGIDPAVATEHLDARQIFQWAHRSGAQPKEQAKEVEWCRACRELCTGTTLFLRQARQAYGGTVPDLPVVKPEFDAELQAAFQRVAPEAPKPREAAAPAQRGGGGKAVLVVVVVLALAGAAAAWFATRG